MEVSGADGTGTAGDDNGEVAELEMLTRALVGITGAGRDLVASVVARRHELLAAVLARMTPGDRTAVARAATVFTELAGDAAERGTSGPLPL